MTNEQNDTSNKQALDALEENYPAFVKGTLVCVQNPNFKEDDGSNPWLTIDLAALQPKPSVDGLVEALEKIMCDAQEFGFHGGDEIVKRIMKTAKQALANHHKER